jgi:hypothetical protein
MTRKAGQLCPSRRKLLLSMAWTAALAGGGLVLGGRQTLHAQQQKISKEMAKYQDSPKDGHKCSECTFFEAPKACKAVEGDISPDGWCQLWTKAA